MCKCGHDYALHDPEYGLRCDMCMVSGHWCRYFVPAEKEVAK